MKITGIILSAATMLTLLSGVSASAADSAQVYVTVCDGNGGLAAACEKITVTDTDNDGTLTISDALYVLHEEKYEGGAAAGYGVTVTEYGPGISKLWGCESGSGYGYYVNDKAAISLADNISQGDRVAAFVYTDTVGYSDTYCYFDKSLAQLKSGESLSLKLSAAGYDENWNPVVLPVKNAVILVDGKETKYSTDESGSVTLTLDTEGSHLLSASCAGMTMVPPACRAEVLSTKKPAQQPTKQPTSPATGAENGAETAFCVMLGAAALAVIFKRER